MFDDKEGLLFNISALPMIASFLSWVVTSVLIDIRIKREHPEITKKWSGFGGSELYSDAKKADDEYLKKLLKYNNKICPKILILGFLLTCVLEFCTFKWFGR